MKVCPLCSDVYNEETTCPKDGATLILKTIFDDSLIGTVLKEAYRIEEQIGIGGMGAVYRVTQLRLGRSVALKVLLPKFNSAPDIVKRFFREARILSQLNHPNIISIIDFGNTEDGLVYMVMEYLEGQTLLDYVPRGKGLDEDLILQLMSQIGQGLAAAHQLPLIHRDLKPGNVFLAQVMGKGWTAKILDFGISKILDDIDENLTHEGMVMGTPGYIAPEQITFSSEPTIATDIYALGGILYFMMGGRSPYHHCTGYSALTRQLQADPDPIPAHEMADPSIEKFFPVVLKAMQREPSARYGSVIELLDDLFARSDSEKRHSDPLLQLPNAGIQPKRSQDSSHLERLTSGSRNLSQSEINTIINPAKPNILKRTWPWLLGVLAILALGFMGWKFYTSTNKTPLIFGMSADFSGSNREIGREMQLGIQTYFHEANKNGGVNGHPLELIALDDRYEPEPAKANFVDLVENRNAFAIIGSVGTPTAKAAIPLALEKSTLFFGPFSGAGILRKDPPDRYVFNYRASYQEETTALIRYFVSVRGIPPNGIAVFSQNDSYGDDGFRGVVRTLREFGVEEQDILHVRYERNEFQLDEAVSQVLAKPDAAKAIVIIGTYRQASRFITAVRTEQPQTLFASVSFVGARALAEAFREVDPKLAEGVVISQVVPFYGSNATGVIRYRNCLEDFAPNQRPSFVSLEGYIAAKILVTALRRSDKLETEAVIDTLESMQNLDLGTGSILSFSPSRHQASHKVWAVVMDEKAQFKELALDGL